MHAIIDKNQLFRNNGLFKFQTLDFHLRDFMNQVYFYRKFSLFLFKFKPLISKLRKYNCDNGFKRFKRILTVILDAKYVKKFKFLEPKTKRNYPPGM